MWELFLLIIGVTNFEFAVTYPYYLNDPTKIIKNRDWKFVRCSEISHDAANIELLLRIFYA